MDLNSRIENSIQSQKFGETTLLIKKLLRLEKNSNEARLAASDYYRRISLHSDALRVLDVELKSIHSGGNETEVLLQIQLARCLNLVGASRTAIRIIQKTPTTLLKKNNPAVVGILLSNYQFLQALEYLPKWKGTLESKLTYRERLTFLSVADCLSGLKRHEESKELLEQLLSQTIEPHLKGILHQVLATQWIHLSKLSPAKNELDQAHRFLKNAPKSLDYAFVLKWMGVLQIAENKHVPAEKLLKQAYQAVHKPGLKPESWLEVLFYLGLTRFKQTGKTPEEWIRLHDYPGIHGPYLPTLADAIEPMGKHWIDSKKPLNRAPHEWIDLKNETRFSNSEGYSCGLTLIDEMIYHLVIAGPHGIPLYRLYETLWPNETFSFAQFRKRFEQLQIQSRKKGNEITIQSGHVRSIPPTRTGGAGICLQMDPSIRGKCFLEQHPRFTRLEVEKFFSMSKRSAQYLCEDWLKGKNIAKEGASSNSTYRVLKINQP